MFKQIAIACLLLGLSLSTITFADTVSGCSGAVTYTSTDTGSWQTPVASYAWSWTDADSTSFTSVQTGDAFDVAELGIDGTYTLSLTVTDSTSGTALTDTTTKSVTLSTCTVNTPTIVDTIDVCSGTLVATPSVTLASGETYTWETSTDSGTTYTAVSGVTTGTLNASDINANGTYDVRVTIVGKLSSTSYYVKEQKVESGVELSWCGAGALTIDKTNVPGTGCSGSLTGTLANVATASTYAWSWENSSDSTKSGTYNAASFDVAAQIGVDGTYDITYGVTGKASDTTTDASDYGTASITLAGCPGVAVLNKTGVSGCTGSVSATLDKVSSTPVYSWTWSGSSSSTAAVTDTTLDVSKIGADGTYTVSLTVSGKAADGTTDVSDMAEVSVTLSSCSSGPSGDDDDDDDSSKVLGVIALLLVALLL